ncbi:mechanosensitive ion channel family protein [Candidatus Woesearchaeota archaeon]|nr:mechanosensitive ion channel family protein [Candidatus Woesearchaeota archaeon]
MINIIQWMQDVEIAVPVIRTLIIFVILYVLLRIIMHYMKKKLAAKMEKKQLATIALFSKMFRYVYFFIVIMVLIFSFTGSWTGLGLGLGLISAGLGFALQRPIVGLLAWIVIAVKRPFVIGDRVMINQVKGDIIDLTLSHLVLEEVGGIVPGEENTGRIIYFPLSAFFEQNIINYGKEHGEELVLDEVIATFTYESNLEIAENIMLAAAQKHTKGIKAPKPPRIRHVFDASGIRLHVRFFSLARSRFEMSSKITKEIFTHVMAEKSVGFAYPHTEIVFKGKR